MYSPHIPYFFVLIQKSRQKKSSREYSSLRLFALGDDREHNSFRRHSSDFIRCDENQSI